MKVRELQERLKALGCDPGDIDGVYGRQTIGAVKMFQQMRGILVDGIVGPETLRALQAADSKPVAAKDEAITTMTPWIDLCLRKKGLHEEKDFTELSKFLASDGRRLGDPRKLPWCGDLVETCIALTCPNEILPANPYLARNWSKMGVYTPPTFGAVLIFWRGAKNGTSGHVGFYVGEDKAGFYHVLGGNQSNAISVARIAKNRLIGGEGGSRWPKSVPLPGTGKRIVTASGTVTTNEA